MHRIWRNSCISFHPHIDTFSNKLGTTLDMVAVERIAPILPIMIDVMVAMRTV